MLARSEQHCAMTVLQEDQEDFSAPWPLIWFKMLKVSWGHEKSVGEVTESRLWDLISQDDHTRNPTGQVLTRENLEAVIKFAADKKLLVFADEVSLFYFLSSLTRVSLPGVSAECLCWRVSFPQLQEGDDGDRGSLQWSWGGQLYDLLQGVHGGVCHQRWDSSVTTTAFHTHSPPPCRTRNRSWRARPGLCGTLSCLAWQEQLSQGEQLNEKTGKVGRPGLFESRKWK
jgi:hypothetical protein